jgi:hypothetical protein
VEREVFRIGWYLVSTSNRPVLLFPRSPTAVERNMLSMERMLIMLSISPSHLYSRDNSSRWARRGGIGILLTYLPYGVISSRGSGVRHLISRSNAKQALIISSLGCSMNYSSLIFGIPMALS